MAKPIEPTPVLEGEEAALLLRELENVCSADEAKRRVERARQRLAEVMKPKSILRGTGTPAS